MHRRIQPWLLAGAVGSLALALAGGGRAEPPDLVQHQVVEVVRNDRGMLLGYEVFHDEHKELYLAMVSPASASRPACQVQVRDVLEMTREAPYSYLGRDGSACLVTAFAPVGDSQAPGGTDRSGPVSCPTCPPG